MYRSLIYFLLFLLVVGISLRTCSESSESNNEEYTENIEESVTSIETTKEPTILVENCDIVYDTTHKEDKSQSTTINNNLTICYGDSNLHVIEYMGYEVVFYITSLFNDTTDIPDDIPLYYRTHRGT